VERAFGGVVSRERHFEVMIVRTWGTAVLRPYGEKATQEGGVGPPLQRQDAQDDPRAHMQRRHVGHPACATCAALKSRSLAREERGLGMTAF
jgi:hypothetical protein